MLLTGYMTLGKWLNLSKPLFPFLKNGDNNRIIVQAEWPHTCKVLGTRKELYKCLLILILGQEWVPAWGQSFQLSLWGQPFWVERTNHTKAPLEKSTIQGSLVGPLICLQLSLGPRQISKNHFTSAVEGSVPSCYLAEPFRSLQAPLEARGGSGLGQGSIQNFCLDLPAPHSTRIPASYLSQCFRSCSHTSRVSSVFTCCR